MPEQTTDCTQPVFTTPLKFLGATVLSFTSSIGFGQQESSISVDLVEDCVGENPDNFAPKMGSIDVGAPVFFPDSPAPAGFLYTFGGVLTNWTASQNSSGRVYNAKVSDPRQLLENVAVIVDSSLVAPIQAPNYINLYASYESTVADGNCTVFGDAKSGERGMPYIMAINELDNLDPIIHSPTGYSYKVAWEDFPTAPDYYRVTGPQTVLQILQDVCDVRGFEFYCWLEKPLLLGDPPLIRIGKVDLKSIPSSFSNIVASFDGIATDLSYGLELRNEKTKSIMFGEQVHYLSYVDCFNHYFGEERNDNNELEPIIATKNNADGTNFWISKRVTDLNLGLYKPLPTNGPYRISEIQIRAAMASRQAWDMVVLDPNLENTEGDLAKALRANYPGVGDDFKAALNFLIVPDPAIAPNKDQTDTLIGYFNPNSAKAKKGEYKTELDLNRIHQFVANIGNTYYGKQFIAPLNEKICWYRDPEHPFGELVFSSVPTNAGGWYEENLPVLGLSDPDLGVFRSEDNRVVSFGVFNIEGESESPEDDGSPSSSSS
jgi:hypothetical protein